MRKRLVIGAISIVLIGTAAYFLSAPRIGSIEWQERKYWKLRAGDGQILNLLRSTIGMENSSAAGSKNIQRLMALESALLSNGCLVERLVLVSNRAPDQVLSAAAPALGRIGFSQYIIEGTTTNGLRLLTRSNDAAALLPQVEAVLRQADTPP